jgi:hypothetical protein
MVQREMNQMVGRIGTEIVRIAETPNRSDILEGFFIVGHTNSDDRCEVHQTGIAREVKRYDNTLILSTDKTSGQVTYQYSIYPCRQWPTEEDQVSGMGRTLPTDIHEREIEAPILTLIQVMRCNHGPECFEV